MLIQNVRGEVRPIRDHFVRVLHELRRATPSGLGAPHRHARSRVLDQLEDYAEAGRFPSNRGEAPFLPVFHDAEGPRCAAAHLLDLDGHEGRRIAGRFAAAHNTLRFGDLPEGGLREELGAWLDAHGLTLDELSLIQPGYGHGPPMYEQAPLAFAVFYGVGAALQLGLGSLVAVAVVEPLERRGVPKAWQVGGAAAAMCVLMGVGVGADGLVLGVGLVIHGGALTLAAVGALEALRRRSVAPLWMLIPFLAWWLFLLMTFAEANRPQLHGGVHI